MKQKISSRSKLLLVVAALLLAVSLFVPIWAIYLDAPQYPEGLQLQIWASRIAGDIDIINGLNHYIGMRTLRSNDFVEFTVLPYLIAVYAILFMITAFAGRKKWLYFLLGAFLLFGIVAMVDFWKWEYDYGHNLDPNAAIRVPGMAYQPPLIGAKQLLNFHAYSIPDIGGWLFISAGVLLAAAAILESRLPGRAHKNKVPTAVAALTILMLNSCGSSGPEPIHLHHDACDFCKMSISDGRFAAELITTKGRVYKFDDLGCMIRYAAATPSQLVQHYYVSDFTNDHQLTDATTAWYVQNEALRSPMAGNTAAFAGRDAATAYGAQNQATVISWEVLYKTIQQKMASGHEAAH
ncbi:nitrous oxide reductase accessory protein NosL [Niabella drilacis]|uniref:Copper chaperone NosL n=1 Tax=Niabella drilacis (strain DSM 25811 / CCM 8410 / CCUG 62505 / LMG 26954 / E90) TaxID=1285928 RepID=A0A1G6IIR2_NIADE|nr:nitrous oxide reductase accessory protein NosL [Niabella drilacis]SDC06300.1 copper chaperone NosL [Niabella drilacis]